MNQKKFTIYFWKKNYPCSLDVTDNMVAPDCVHLDNFVNFTSVLGYFILNSHVRIGIYHSKTVWVEHGSRGGGSSVSLPSTDPTISTHILDGRVFDMTT